MTATENGSRVEGSALVLPIVQPQQLHALNAFFRHRRPLGLQVGQRMVQASPAWLDKEPGIEDACTITLKIDGSEGDIVVPKALLDQILAELDPALSFESVETVQRAILLEFVLSGALDALTSALGCTMSISSVVRSAGQPRGEDYAAAPVSLRFEGEEPFWCLLRLASADIRRLAGFINHASAHDNSLLDLPVPFHLRWASVLMTLGEIDSLTPGDIILVDDACRQEGHTVAVFGEHLTAMVDMSSDGCRLASRPRRAQGTGWEWLVDQPQQSVRTPGNGSLANVPVRVLFELGEGDLSLSEVSRLNPGAILPVAVPSELAFDIVINGARIGRGEPTQIGEALGIRVTRLANAA